MKIDWKHKLSSRKFWAAIVAVIISLSTIFGLPEMTTQQLIGLITAISSLVAYILGETIVDAAGASAKNQETPVQQLPTSALDLLEEHQITITKNESEEN